MISCVGENTEVIAEELEREQQAVNDLVAVTESVVALYALNSVCAYHLPS